MNERFVVYRQTDEDIDHVNAWYRRCQEKRLPYITVRQRRKYADIQWDHINLPKEFDDVIREKGDAFVRGFIDIFKRHANQKSSYRAGAFVVEFTDIDVAQASAVANDLYEYVCTELGIAKAQAEPQSNAL